VRRDAVPHRGNWLRLWGGISLALGLFSFVLLPLAVVAVAAGLLVLRLTEGDLAQMKAGLMDPQGRDEVAQARGLASAGIAAGVVAALICGAVGLSALLRML
jgi:hypothetical protein